MTKTKTVYDHIKSNNIKTALLVLLFPVIFIALVFLFVRMVSPLNDAINTTISVAIPTFVICMVWMLISWAFGDSMMLSMAGAHKLDINDKNNRQIYNLVENIALAAGLPTPNVYIIEDNSLNAFATGRTPADATVALTRGIINKLDTAELSGVIAHEMAHIGNRDIRLDMLIITGIGVTVFIADIIFRSAVHSRHINTSDDNNNNNSAAILMMIWLAFSIFNLIITPLLQMAISRKREYAADATGAFITRNPHALASALQKISTDSRIEQIDKTQSMASIFIASPTRPRSFISELMATHPPIRKRINRLKSMCI